MAHVQINKGDDGRYRCLIDGQEVPILADGFSLEAGDGLAITDNPYEGGFVMHARIPVDTLDADLPDTVLEVIR